MLALAAARAFIVELQSLDIRADEESATRILTDVHGLALTHGLTSYDAAYLEVALRRNLPLATLDADLVQASKDAGVTVLEA
jgi:predicted nucleic acid-binding protein